MFSKVSLKGCNKSGIAQIFKVLKPIPLTDKNQCYSYSDLRFMILQGTKPKMKTKKSEIIAGETSFCRILAHAWWYIGSVDCVGLYYSLPSHPTSAFLGPSWQSFWDLGFARVRFDSCRVSFGRALKVFSFVLATKDKRIVVISRQAKHATGQSTNQSTSHSTSKSINQSINQSINKVC